MNPEGRVIEVISLTNVAELSMVKLFLVKGLIIGIRNLAILYPAVFMEEMIGRNG